MLVACACSAQARTARHLDRADRVFDRKQYREAVLEYRNVLDQEPNNERAVRRLGIAHYELGEFGQAYSYLSRASEADPTDVEVRSRLGVLLALSRHPDEARRHADAVLEKDPKNLDALAILAETADGPAELDEAIRRVEEVRGQVAERDKASRLLGGLYLKKRNVLQAEKAFHAAVEAAPLSVEAHTSLAIMHLAQRRFALAEKEFKAAADAAPPASPARLRLADFYVSQGDVESGRQILAGIVAEAPDYAPAWLRQTELAVAEKNYAAAERVLDTVLQKNPRSSGALLLRAHVRLAQGRTDEAIQEIQVVIRQEPKFPPAHYQLAMAQLKAGNQQQARASLREAVDLAPGFTEAVLRLAGMNLEADSPGPAIDDLNKLLQKRPGLVRAHELLGSAYLEKGDSMAAGAVFQKLQALLPTTDPRAAYYDGLTLRQQGRRAEARQAFARSLALLPGAPDPLNQIVDMAFEDKQPDVALAIAQKQVSAAPRSVSAQHVMGRVHQRRGELPQAEAAFRRAAELDPGHAPARLDLGKVHAARNRPDEALAAAAEVLKINPGSADGWLLSGVAYQSKGDLAKAQDAFKKALDIDPRLAPAANNLAWLYAEHGGDPDEALRLAQLAKEVAPDDPYVSDTLGWVFFKRGIYQRALALLKESAAQLPDSAEVHFHLGMTHYKLGDKPAARQALTRALELDATFPGAVDARHVLSQL